MTDQEINEAVARKLGWQLDKGLWWSPIRTEIPILSTNNPLPDFCNKIEAAWEVLEKFPSMGLFRTKESGWYCMPEFSLSENETEEWYFKAENDRCGSLASTAPMAICLAYLKLP